MSDVPAGHFYSPIPDLAQIDCTPVVGALDAVFRVEDEAVLSVARDVYAFAPELQRDINSGRTQYQWCNPAFPPADAMAYTVCCVGCGRSL